MPCKACIGKEYLKLSPPCAEILNTFECFVLPVIEKNFTFKCGPPRFCGNVKVSVFCSAPKGKNFNNSLNHKFYSKPVGDIEQ